jgi:GT2 family glycosyltransferase
MKELSVIIVNWNTKGFLLPCLRSFLGKEQGIPREVIVVDNGSQDGSVDAVKKEFPSICSIENEKNLGFAKAVNQGLRIFSGEYALLLNPDTEAKEGTIETLFTFMEAHPEAGAAGAQLLNSDGTKQNSIANFPSLTIELFNKRVLRWLLPERFPGKERSYAEAIEVDSVIGACMIVRRKVIEKVGFLDEDYFLFLEETDWCYRMKKAGWKVYHVPQAEVFHFQGKSAEQNKKRAKIQYYRSRYQFFKKHKGGRQWFFLLIGLMIKLIVEFVLMGIANLFTFFRIHKWRRRISIYVYLLWWHLRGCPERI